MSHRRLTGAVIAALVALIAAGSVSANTAGPSSAPVPQPDWANVSTTYDTVQYGAKVVRQNRTRVFNGIEFVDVDFRDNARIVTAYQHGVTCKQLKLLKGQRVLAATVNYVGIDDPQTRATKAWSGKGCIALRRWMNLEDLLGASDERIQIVSITALVYDPTLNVPPNLGGSSTPK